MPVNLAFGEKQLQNTRIYNTALVLVVVLPVLLSCAVVCFLIDSRTRDGVAEYIHPTEFYDGQGIDFCSTLIIPLLTIDYSRISDLIVLFIIVTLIVLLIYRGEYFYSSCMLTLLGYHAFEFEVDSQGIIKVGIAKRNVNLSSVVCLRLRLVDFISLSHRVERTNMKITSQMLV